ncbi:MAG: phospholipase D-like domain-containing protein [Myxococcota bacterium]
MERIVSFLALGVPTPWAYGVALVSVGGLLGASVHVILTKRDERAAAGWLGVIVLAPLVGALLYLTLGINRIRRTAFRLRGPRPAPSPPPKPTPVSGPPGLVRSLDALCRFPRVALPRVDVLVDGDEAYPAMWEAIERAESSISLSTYIFDRDLAGEGFIERLAQAQARGVEVRVLADDAGLRYSWPTVLRTLRRRGVRVRRFLPAGLRSFAYLNLRTHRKILVVDDEVGFTGGINIRVGHQLAARPKRPVRDLHFRVMGPLVGQLHQVFWEDWTFAGGDRFDLPTVNDAGSGCEPSAPWARTISDGPDEDLDQLLGAYLAGLACAERSVRILTPYFLPDQSLQSALATAALRGVQVDVVIPARCNLPFVQWAMWGQIRTMVDVCRVWLSPPPFDHSKLMVVDECWVLFGSGNWDPRSYRLNFELDVEAYDQLFGRQMADLVDHRIGTARRLTAADLDARSLPCRLRDGVARLFAPIL